MFTFHDGSILRIMMARDLVAIPVWKGNRTLDVAHAATIAAAVTDIRTLDSGYRIVNYMEPDATGTPVRQSYLIDGQHRCHILRSATALDFPVVVTEKDVASESDAIDFFNTINTVKPQQWSIDPALVVNLYIVELEKAFPKMIRPSTHRPYLSVDRLREALKRLPLKAKAVTACVARARAKNEVLLQDAIMRSNYDLVENKRAIAIGFMLGLDLGWVKECCA
jgi:hypothetical protein